MSDIKKKESGKGRTKKLQLNQKKVKDLTARKGEQIKGGIPKQYDSGSGGGYP